VSFLLDGIELMVIGGDQRDVQTFRESRREGVGKRDSLSDFNDANPLDKSIVRIAMEYERKRQGVCPNRLGGLDPSLRKKS
jgi:hypothetical protein